MCSVPRSCLVVLACIAFAGPAAGEPTAELPAASADETEAARALFMRAVALAADGDWHAALRHYERSYAVKPSPETRHSVGVAQLQTGRIVAARSSFHAYLRDTEPGPERDELRDAAKRALVVTRLRVARITLVAHPEKAIIRLNGARVPRGRTTFVDPGVHVAEVTAPGHTALARAFAIAAGERRTLELRMSPFEGPAASVPRVPLGLLIAGGVLFSAGVTMGVAAIVTADGAREDSRGATDARALAIGGDVVGATGLGLSAMGAIWWLVEQSADPTDAASATVAPWTEGAVGGISVAF